MAGCDNTLQTRKKGKAREEGTNQQMLFFVKKRTVKVDSKHAVKGNNHKVACCANKKCLSLVSHSCSLSIHHLHQHALYQGTFSGDAERTNQGESKDSYLKRVSLKINSVLHTHIKKPLSKPLCGALHMQH